MNILAIISGEYGKRHVANLQAHCPDGWKIEVWNAPTILPPVIDYPEDYLPESLPSADLVLAFGEHRGITELVPEVARLSGAKAVIAPIDSEAWLPRGLARQLRGWLEQISVTCVTPKPLCSLTESSYDLSRWQKIRYDNPLIAEFSRYFGKPEFKIDIDPKTRTITHVEVLRDAVCGCARYVAEGLVGISVDEAEYTAGMRHHHFPCLASMGKDPDYGDTLMHISGHILRDMVGEQVKHYKRIQYIAPGTKSE